jgi:D-alanyl-D-alanine carboxypeptidase
LRPSLGTVDNLVPIDASPPNLRDEMCNGKRKRPATDEDADTTVAASGSESPALAFVTAGLQAPLAKPSELLAGTYTAGEPMVVYTGPKRTGAALIAAVAADDQKQVTRKRGKKSRVAAKKPDADGPKTAARTEAKSDKPAAKPPAVRHANAKPDGAAKPAAKPAASAEKPAAKPAKPKAAAKPKSETKPAG